MSSYFITGGNGFIGSAIVRELLRQGNHVRMMLRAGANTNRLTDVLAEVETVPGTLDDLDAAQKSLQQRRADVVIHCAWAGVTGASRNNAEQITLNIPATLRLCEIAAKSGCSTFVGLGSQAEYGTFSGVLDESTPAYPVTSYGFAKLTAGSICRNYCDLVGMRFIWLRVLSVYGPGDDEAHMIPTVIRQMLRREKPSLTAGIQKWDYLYIDDCATAITSVIQSGACGVFVLGSGYSLPIHEVVETLRDKIDPTLPLGFGEVQHSSSGLNLECSIRRLIEATGWQPKVPLGKGLELTIASLAGSGSLACVQGKQAGHSKSK